MKSLSIQSTRIMEGCSLSSAKPLADSELERFRWGMVVEGFPASLLQVVQTDLEFPSDWEFRQQERRFGIERVERVPGMREAVKPGRCIHPDSPV